MSADTWAVYEMKESETQQQLEKSHEESPERVVMAWECAARSEHCVERNAMGWKYTEGVGEKCLGEVGWTV